jgi:hypothetical protein
MRKSLLAGASDETLRRIIDVLYRLGSTFGDGGTADALRREIRTGLHTRGRGHKQKATDTVKRIRRLLRRNDLSMLDRIIADWLLTDLQDAIRLG